MRQSTNFDEVKSKVHSNFCNRSDSHSSLIRHLSAESFFFFNSVKLRGLSQGLDDDGLFALGHCPKYYMCSSIFLFLLWLVYEVKMTVFSKS